MSEEQFWNWFMRNEGRLAAALPEGAREVIGEVTRALHGVSAGVHAELAMSPQGNQLVLSADGARRAFGDVLRIAQAAPHMHGWRVVAFRPRQAEGGQIRVGGSVIAPGQVWFTATRGENSTVDLTLYLPGRVSENAARQIILILLDTVLGEYDVETCIGGLALGRGQPPHDARPLTELPLLADSEERWSVSMIDTTTQRLFVRLRDGTHVLETAAEAPYRVTIQEQVRTPGGLPDQAEFERLSGVEAGLMAALETRARLSAVVTRVGLRLWHFYAANGTECARIVPSAQVVHEPDWRLYRHLQQMRWAQLR